MGCCVCKPGELNGFEKIVLVSQGLSESKEFVEISLDSESGEKEIEEWQRYKNGQKVSFSDSLAINSTILHSERMSSVFSKPGSIIDSFTVNLHNSMSK